MKFIISKLFRKFLRCLICQKTTSTISFDEGSYINSAVHLVEEIIQYFQQQMSYNKPTLTGIEAAGTPAKLAGWVQ